VLCLILSGYTNVARDIVCSSARSRLRCQGELDLNFTSIYRISFVLAHSKVKVKLSL
jgi:hypothetical protein